MRRIWYDQGGDKQVNQAITDAMLYGRGYVRFRGDNHNSVQDAATGEF
jgi:hypothetical protein